MFGGLFVWSISCVLSQVWTDSQQMRIIVSLEFTLPMIHGGLQSPRTVVHYYDHQGSFSQFSYKSYEILQFYFGHLYYTLVNVFFSNSQAWAYEGDTQNSYYGMHAIALYLFLYRATSDMCTFVWSFKYGVWYSNTVVLKLK